MPRFATRFILTAGAYIAAFLMLVSIVFAASPSRAVGAFSPYTGDPVVSAATTVFNRDAETSVAVTGLVTDATLATNIVPVQLRVNSGSLSLGATTGLTFTSAQTGSFLRFSGTETDVNAALASLNYTKGSSNTVTLGVDLLAGGDFFCESSGHIYRVVDSAVTYSTAATAAASGFNNHGYLVTPSTQAENDCVFEKVAEVSGSGTTNFTWIGAQASLNGSTVEYKWDTSAHSPDSGNIFYTGSACSGGSAYNGAFNSWDRSWAHVNPDCTPTSPDLQPNAKVISNVIQEPCVVYWMLDNPIQPDWHDVDCAIKVGGKYVIEAGGPDLPTVSRTSIALNFGVAAPAPTTTSTASPAPVAANVEGNSGLLALTSSTPIRNALIPAAVILGGLSLVLLSLSRSRQVVRRRGN